MSRSDGSSSVKSATRTLDILEYVVGCGRPVGAMEIATALAIPMSSLSYLLSTLVERDYLAREGRLHRPGPAIARLQPPDAARALSERVVQQLRVISQQLNETAAFFVRRDYQMEAIASEVSAQALRYNVEIGRPLPLHAFAAGKAILAAFDEATLADYFAQVERPAFTPQTLTSEAELRAALADIRTRGLARTQGEYTPGIVGIGRAVTAPDGGLIGAISVAIPQARMTPALEARAGALLIEAGDALSGA